MTNNTVDKSRRNWIVGASVVGLVGTGFLAVPFLGAWTPSERAKAIGGPVEVDITKLLPGAQQRTVWRGKAIYVLRMTEEMIETLGKVESEGKLKDPSSSGSDLPERIHAEGKRSIKDNVMVLTGVCTHLGCAPVLQNADQGKTHSPDWIGGFFCPCHGSKFDYSGRVFQGAPAPTNLTIPPYYFKSDDVIVIGQDGEEAVS